MSLYDELGGAPAVSVALDRFYARVPDHPVIGRFFEGVDFASLKQRAAPFVTMALGGPNEYKGPGLRNVHKYLLATGLDDQAFDAFVGLFRDVLRDLGVPEDKIAQVTTIMDGARGEVLNR